MRLQEQENIFAFQQGGGNKKAARIRFSTLTVWEIRNICGGCLGEMGNFGVGKERKRDSHLEVGG